MPTLHLFFGPKFCDPLWADRCFRLDAPKENAEGRVGEWLLGRHPTADLTINCRDVSRRHAAISYSYAADLWSIADLGSSAGTRVEGKLLEPGNPTPLRVGTRIWLGGNLVQVVEDEGDTLGGSEPGEATVFDTKPLDYRPQEAQTTAPTTPIAAPPHSTKTTADAIYLAAQWCITPTTRVGAVVRLVVLGVAAVVAVVIFDQ